MQLTPQRRLFSLIDGIIGGDNKGPLEPDPVHSGFLIGGTNFLAADIVGTRVMGFDPFKVKTISNLLSETGRDLGVREMDDIDVVADEPEIRNCLGNAENRFAAFRPYPGWAGHLEI